MTADEIFRLDWEYGDGTLSEIRMFRSRVHPKVYQGAGGIFIVTSEDFGLGRCYSVREFNERTFTITLRLEAKHLGEAAQAHKVAEALAEGKGTTP